MAQATTYAVHTEACTYLLDEDGICCRILSPGGLVTPGMSAAVGAQFVACLDLAVPGGLVAELRVGSAALFTAKDENGRYVLLRTSPIRGVEARQSERPFLPPPVIPASLPPRGKTPSRPPKAPPKSGRIAKGGSPPRPPSPLVLRGGEGTGPSLSEETLSLAKPLFKPQPPPPPNRPRAPPVPAPRSIAVPSAVASPAPPVSAPATPRKPPAPPPVVPKKSSPPPAPAPPAPPVPAARRAPSLPPPRPGPPDIPSTPPRSRRTDPNRKGKR